MKRTLVGLICSVLLIAILLPGCTAKGSWLEDMNRSSQENKYTLLYIDDGNSKEGTTIRESMKENAGQMPDQFKFVEVNYNNEKESILKYLQTTGISSFPLALSIAPNGAITGAFTKKCSAAELKATVCSNKECDVRLTLQKSRVAVICIYNGQPADLERVKKELKTIETNFNGVVVTHYLNKAEQADTAFIEKLPETKADITVYITVPPGSINAMLEGDQITTTNLLQAIQTSCSSGSCGPSGCS